MCFSISYTKDIIERDPRFSWLLEDSTAIGSGYYISGFTFPQLPVLTAMGGITAGWGLIPHWARDPQKAKSIRSKTLNARSETVSGKSSFRNSWPHQRCVIPVTGYYEPHLENKVKSTWFITPKNRNLLFLGGLYQKRPSSLSSFPEWTFSILTVPARDLLAEVHNEKLRMPLMLAAGSEENWLTSDRPLDERWYFDRNTLDSWQIDKTLIRRNPDHPDIQKPYRPGNQAGLFP